MRKEQNWPLGLDYLRGHMEWYLLLVVTALESLLYACWAYEEWRGFEYAEGFDQI